MKHKVTIRVADETGRRELAYQGERRRFPTRLLRLLFGGYTTVYLMTPGKTIDTIRIEEIKEESHERGKEY